MIHSFCQLSVSHELDNEFEPNDNNTKMETVRYGLLLPHVDDSFKTLDSETNVAFMRKYLILSAYPARTI